MPWIDANNKFERLIITIIIPPTWSLLFQNTITLPFHLLAKIHVYINIPLLFSGGTCIYLYMMYSHSTRLLAATTLRNVLGTRNLAEILSERESISSTMQSSLDEATDPWGVKVERVEMWVTRRVVGSLLLVVGAKQLDWFHTVILSEIKRRWRYRCSIQFNSYRLCSFLWIRGYH